MGLGLSSALEHKCTLYITQERFNLDYREPISQMLLERISKRGGDPG